MEDLIIAPVARASLPLLHQALQQLSADLGDRHVADLATLKAAGFGKHLAYRALIAVRGNHPAGAVVFSPQFSTTRGGGGLYVSDLWVARSERGSGLGKRLLASALAEAQTSWGAKFIRLAVYDDKPQAQRFYQRLGFAAQSAESNMILHGPALDMLKAKT